MITILSFLRVNNKNGVSTFCNNIISTFGDNVNVLSLFKNKESCHQNEKCLNVPYNKISKILNWISSYRISAYLFARKMPSNTKIVIVNAPSMIRYVDPGIKMVAVQHHQVDKLISNKANFNNDPLMIKKFIERVDRFVVLSERDRTEVVGKLDIDVNKVVVIPHMVRLEKSEPRAMCNKKLVMLARLDNKQKRFDLVLNAMTKCLDWELNIYGDGHDRNYILEMIESLNLTNVKLHPVTNDVELALSSNDVHLMTSDFEGFGFSNIEAMRKGLPLIIRNTFPAAESLVDGNGVLLSSTWDSDEFIESLDYVFNNYKDFSARSLKLSDKFSPDVVSKKWEKMIKELEIDFDK